MTTVNAFHIILQYLTESVFSLIFFFSVYNQCKGFFGGSVVKKPPANAGDKDLIPGSERSPGEGNGNPLQYSCLENPMDRAAWQVMVPGAAKESDMT